MALIFTFFFAVAIVVIVFYVYRRFYCHTYFNRLGITGPKPNWLIGNLGEMINEDTRHLLLSRWSKKYGKIYGYYEGPRPVLVISDVRLVQQVFVKQFWPTFHSRKEFPLQPNPESTNQNVHMFLARGARWRRLRANITPTFSTSKLRLLTPLMNKCVSDFMSLIESRASQDRAFDIFECFKFLTMDVISECAFGVELNSAKMEGKHNLVMDNVKKMFDYLFEIPLVMKLCIILPEFSKLLFWYCRIQALLFRSGFFGPFENLIEVMGAVIADRKKYPEKKRPDLLQTMLELEDPDVASVTHKEESFDFDSTNDVAGKPISRGLTREEIQSQSVLFMIAGFETSSNAMAFASYLLATNPRVQEKLYKEINEAFPNESDTMTYESTQVLKYLDCVINETLRLYPVAAPVTSRQATEPTILDGIQILEDLTVQIDVWGIHHDAEQWGPVDTEKFYPERFLPDYPTQPTRNSAAFLPYGFGPRMCAGMRFAQLEIRLALASLLRTYRIDETSETEKVLKLTVASTMTPRNGILVKLTKRN